MNKSKLLPLSVAAMAVLCGISSLASANNKSDEMVVLLILLLAEIM